ncbi:ComEA family DNA-binding protein [Sanyastnella coralliicola]|uniref:ComEA family DNA-binding protein n=1 Tax=Sanyastnella coralliicola TaxID=3069118 RepID=UPI0027BA80BE|nr:helix-hairpin-helix domain-containing protein [Longitalea sp. SCSIO 12813]
MKLFDSFWRSLELNKRERSGMIVLAFILLAIIAAQSIRRQWVYEEESDPRLAMVLIPEPPEDLTILKEESYFPFNPNELADSGWLALGLSEHELQGLRNYMRSGARFQTREDLDRVYSIPDPWLERHADDLRFYPPEVPTVDVDVSDLASAETSMTTEQKPLLELNTADSIDLQELAGVGAYSARKVLRFRDALGGFASAEQLAEVWGLHPEVRTKLIAQVTIDSTLVKRIAIDTAGKRTIAAHPYISWKAAKALVNYRQHHGPFNQLEDIRGCLLVSDSLYRKIEPYLYLHDRRTHPSNGENRP